MVNAAQLNIAMIIGFFLDFNFKDKYPNIKLPNAAPI